MYKFEGSKNRFVRWYSRQNKEEVINRGYF